MAASSIENNPDLINEVSFFLEMSFTKAKTKLEEFDYVEVARCYYEAAVAFFDISQFQTSSEITLSLPSLQEAPLTVSETEGKLKEKINELGSIVFNHETLHVLTKIHALKFIATAERKLQCLIPFVSSERLETLKEVVLAEGGTLSEDEQKKAKSLLAVMTINTLSQEDKEQVVKIIHEVDEREKREQAAKHFLNKLAEFEAKPSSDNALSLIQAYEQAIAVAPHFNFSQLFNKHRALIPKAFVLQAIATKKKDDIKRAIDICLHDTMWMRADHLGPDYVGLWNEDFYTLAREIGSKFIRDCYTDEELRQAPWYSTLRDLVLFEHFWFELIKGISCFELNKVHSILGLTPLGAMLLLQPYSRIFNPCHVYLDPFVDQLMQQLSNLSAFPLERGGNTFFHLIAASNVDDSDTVGTMAVLMDKIWTSGARSTIEPYIPIPLEDANASLSVPPGWGVSRGERSPLYLQARVPRAQHLIKGYTAGTDAKSRILIGERYISSMLEHHNRYGELPLHVALRRGKIKTAQLLMELGADVHAAALRQSPLALHLEIDSRNQLLCWVNGEHPQASSLPSSSSDITQPIDADTPIMMVLNLIHHSENDIHKNECIQFAISLLQHDVVMPELSMESPLFAAQQEVFQQIQVERIAFLLRIVKAKAALEKKLRWLLADYDMQPIKDKIAALESFLDAYLESSLHRANPILKIFRDWARRQPEHYASLQATTFLRDSDTLKIITEPLDNMTIDCQEKYKTLFGHYAEDGIFLDRIYSQSLRKTLINILNRVSENYRGRYQATFSLPLSQQSDLAQEVQQWNELGQDQLLERLIEQVKDKVSDKANIEHMLNAFLVTRAYHQCVARGETVELSLEQQSVLTDAFILWAPLTRKRDDIKEAINACMQHSFLERREQLFELAEWCQGTREELSDSVMEMARKDFNKMEPSSRPQSKIKQIHAALVWPEESEDPSYISAAFFGIIPEETPEIDGLKISFWRLLSIYHPGDLSRYSWFLAYAHCILLEEFFCKQEYGFLGHRKYLFPLRLMHPIYGVTFLGTMLSLSVPHIDTLFWLGHLTPDNMASEMGSNTILHLAAAHRKESYMKQFLRKPATEANYGGSLVTSENMILLIAMLQHRNQYGEMPLHVALRMGNLELARCFIEIGADVNVPALEYSPLCISQQEEPEVMKTLRWMRSRSTCQYQLSIPVASSSIDVSHGLETPMMIVLRLIKERKEQERSPEELIAFAIELLNYGATYPSADENVLYDSLYQDIEASCKDKKDDFLEKISEAQAKLEKELKSRWSTEDSETLRKSKQEALTSLKSALETSKMPVLRALREWIEKNSELYATLRKVTFFVNDTLPFMDEVLKTAPVYYKEKYKDVFKPSRKSNSQDDQRHRFLPGPASSLESPFASGDVDTANPDSALTAQLK
jgi:ankyrin repeat protein